MLGALASELMRTIFARATPPRLGSISETSEYDHAVPTATNGVSLRADPPIDQRLEDQFTALWARVVDAGGAVNFRPPANEAEIRPVVRARLARVDEGSDHLVAATVDGQLVGTTSLVGSHAPVVAHRASVVGVMVDPAHQRMGLGTALMERTHDLACRLGYSVLTLTCRSGLGLETFYGSLGYETYGVVPGGLLVTDDPLDHHEVCMAHLLERRP